MSGLLSHQVNAVLQDADGYIWAGTTDGLQRFDGTRYRTFRHIPGDTSSLPSNPIQQLLLDKKNNLWILMSDGNVGIFDTKRFIFKPAAVQPKKVKILSTAGKQLITDEFGHIFLLLKGAEVLTWNEKANAFSYKHNFFTANEEWGIGDFIQQPGTQKYWMAITNGNLAIYNHNTKQVSYPGNNVEKEPAIEQFKETGPFHFFFDKQGRLWFINWGKEGFPWVSCYDTKTNRLELKKNEFVTYLKSYHELQGFFQQQDGTLWVRGQGVFARYLEKEQRFEMVYNGYTSERSIAYEMVNSLFEDREKNIWVGTDNNGLYRFNPASEFFANIRHTNRVTGLTGEGSAMSFMPTRWGTVLAGTWGDGLYHYDKNFNLIPTGIKGIDNKVGPFAWSMFASPDSNTIWIAAQPGLYAIDQASRSARYYNPPLLENRTIRQIAEDKNGNLWLGLQHAGLFKWTASKGKNNFNEGVSVYPVISRRSINKITIDSKGYVWVATDVEGVYVIDPDTDQVVLHFSNKAEREKKLPEEGVSGVLEYDDSTMIITTATRILRYNRVLKQSVLVGSGEMISGYIAGMEKDKYGFLWLTTSNGLYRININKRIFVRFNRTDGIDNDHFILAASAVLPDGRLLFGSTNQHILFNPRDIRIPSSFPDIKITGFKVQNKPLLVDSLLQLNEIELDYKKNSLVIEFSPLLYNSAFLIKYKMEGLDKDWIIAEKNNEAVFSYLPPGNYTLLLKIMDEDGREGPGITRLQIRINPPFWKTWWFYSILIVSFGGLLFMFDRERMKRKGALQKMRADIATNLHQEVSTALNNINILSEMARIKADKEPQKSKEFIDQIHNKSESMIVTMDDMLWSIDPNNDSMGKTMLRMKEFIDGLNSRHSLHFEMRVDKKVESLKLNMKFRHDAFLLFKECIYDLIAARANHCRIHVALEKSLLLFTIEVQNASADLQQFRHLLQRQDMSKRMEAIQARLETQIHKSSSVFLLKIPVN